MQCLFLFVSYLACALLIPVVRSQVTFVQPPPPGSVDDYRDNPVFAYGSRILIQWTADLPEDVKRLNLWCKRELVNAQPGDSFGGTLATDMLSAADSYWFSITSTVMDLAESGKFALFMEIDDAESGKTLGISHSFNVTRESQGATTTKASTTRTTTSTTSTTSTTLPSKTSDRTDGAPPSSTQSATSTAPVTSTSQESSTAVSDPEPQSTKKLSKGAVAGIAVGATIGGLLVLGLLGFLIWRYKSGNKGIAYYRAELPANNPTELPAGQEIKGSGIQAQSDDYRGPYAVSE